MARELWCAALAAVLTFACGVGELSAIDTTADAGGATDAAAPLRDDAVDIDWSRRDRARQVMNRNALAAAFAQQGYAPPAGALLMGAWIDEGVEQVAVGLFDYQDSAFDDDFWPASTIKLLAAVGVLDFARSLGFTSSATVILEGIGSLGTLSDICTRAISVSDNLAYTRTVQIAGVEYLNESFLTAENGFEETVLVSSYVSGISARSTPRMTLREGSTEVEIEPRASSEDYGCSSNCTTLFELSDSMRRAALADEVALDERFQLDAAGTAVIRDALLAANSFFASGAQDVLGEVAIYNKPGWVPSRYYLDHGVIVPTAGSRRYLLAIAVPWPEVCSTDGSCRARIAEIAGHVLAALSTTDDGVPLQQTAGTPIAVQIDDDSTGVSMQIDAPGADNVRLYLDDRALGTLSGPGRFRIAVPEVDGEALLTVVASAGGRPIGHRAALVTLPSQ